ncbi:hypothetical protein [Echinimonas agarilytica]|uniref:Uncharacterized protein n=1 Tax=Echinimonas agarilytica TaxID=1215918 RepID=A0AA41WA63_9GAMM|nr:hypothetical protein [Echinimonas agarilytica]MCM2680856.1 hypothetical protein [Echinimonas agarilytica]
MASNFFTWQTHVKNWVKEHHPRVKIDPVSFRRDMEYAYFKRHLSVEQFVAELVF